MNFHPSPLVAALIVLTAFVHPDVPAQTPSTAYIQDITIDSQHPHRIFAATMGAGLFRSADGGDHWTSITPDTILKQCTVVRIDPGDHRRVLAGGEQGGLWASNDGGDTWKKLDLSAHSICDLAFDPSHTSRVFILASDGVYRVDNYSTGPWVKVFDYQNFQKHSWKGKVDGRPWEYSRFQKIAVDPHNPSVVMIGARWEGGYHRSEDGGNTWSHHWVSGMFRRIDPIIFHPSQPGIVYAGTHHQGMFLSCNGGRSWVSMSRGQEPQMRSPYYGAYLTSGLTLQAGRPDTLYTGSDYGNWKTTDGGISWHPLGTTLTCEFARTIAIDPTDHATVYVGTNVGVYRSSDGGAHWIGKNQGFPEVAIRHTLNATIGGTRYEFAVCEGGTPLFRRKTGEDWTPASWDLHERVDSLSFDQKTETLTVFGGAKPYRSSDAGLRWDVPHFVQAPVPVEDLPMMQGEPPCEGPHWNVNVVIPETICSNDAFVDSLYRRPPYVSVQIVTTGYPLDGSIPYWQGTYIRGPRGDFQIPLVGAPSGTACLLYVEARDFQKNVQTGYAAIEWGRSQTVEVHVSSQTLLPAFLGAQSSRR